MDDPGLALSPLSGQISLDDGDDASAQFVGDRSCRPAALSGLRSDPGGTMTQPMPNTHAWLVPLSAALLLVQAGSFVAHAEEPRVRLRELGVVVGRYQPGPFNAITDVAGVKVGHVTHVRGEGALKPGEGPVRTGATVIIPRDDVWHKKVPAGSFVLNGTPMVASFVNA